MTQTIDLSNIKKVVNEPFYPLLSNKDRYLVLRGGRGSGKSEFVAQKILLRILKSYETGITHKFLVLRKTAPDVRRSVFDLLIKYIVKWKLQDMVKIIKNPPTMTFTNGSKILCSGLDDAMKVKSTTDVTGAWMEEAIEFDLADFRAVDEIIRGKFNDYFQIVLSFNPVNKNWIYKEFFEEPKANAHLHLSTYKDNRFINKEYGEMLENYANISTYHYQINCLGEWGVLEGVIFDNWSTVSEMPSGDFLYGCDFGYSNSETAVVKVRKEEDDLYFQELLYKTKMTNDDLKKWLLRYTKPGVYIYCDSAEPARIEELRRAGLRVRPTIKGKRSVLNGIDYMKQHRIKVVRSGQNLVNEMSGYLWKTKGDRTIDEPVMVNDHLIDAARYAVYTHWGRKQTQLQVHWI